MYRFSEVINVGHGAQVVSIMRVHGAICHPRGQNLTDCGVQGAQVDCKEDGSPNPLLLLLSSVFNTKIGSAVLKITAIESGSNDGVVRKYPSSHSQAPLLLFDTVECNGGTVIVVILLLPLQQLWSFNNNSINNINIPSVLFLVFFIATQNTL